VRVVLRKLSSPLIPLLATQGEGNTNSQINNLQSMAKTQLQIAIIGAGFTGLTAAYRLSEAGHKVTILERSSELGGLASGFVVEGENLEKAYHHIFKTDTDIINLVKELGLSDKLEWHESSMSVIYKDKVYTFGTPKSLLLFKPLSFINRIRAGVAVLYLQKTKNWKKFEKISAYSWMKKWSGEQVTKVLYEPILKGKFHDDFDKVSMAWMWARLHTRANSKDKGDTKEKLGYFNGGFKIIVDELLRRLKKNGVEIKTNTQISDIRYQTSKVEILALDEKILEFDKVIATVPSSVFAKLTEKSITKEYFKKLNSIKYLGAICMVFSSEQNIGNYYWNNINDANSPFVVFINHTKLIPKSRYNNKNIYYLGAYLPHEHRYFGMEQVEIEKEWFKYLKKIFPDFNETQIREKHLFKLRNAQHIVDLDYKNKIPDYETPLENVYLSNFSQIYPEDRGTNFAVREGNKISELICLKV
jgi:protoporphyrinogen oxidase